MAAFRINLRIFSNHIMKNFQVKYHIPQNIFFRKLYVIIITPWPCQQQDFLLLTGPGIYPQVYHSLAKWLSVRLQTKWFWVRVRLQSLIEPHVLQYLLVRVSNKKTKEGQDYFKFHKRRDFFISYINQVINLQCGPLFYTLPKKVFPLQFGQEENIPGNSIERRVYQFILKIARVLPIPTGRVGIG